MKILNNGKLTANITGVDALLRTLNSLPLNVSGKLVKPAMAEAGRLLSQRARWNAYKVLQGSEKRGYRRTEGQHLYETAGARTKTYRKGETFYVAVGYNYSKGGYHAHLVELGHRIVRGGTLERTGKLPGLTAAGKRWLKQHGLVQGNYKVPSAGRKGKKLKTLRGAWRYQGARAWNKYGLTPGKVYQFGVGAFGRRIRGGGKVVVNKNGNAVVTRKFPMLKPAFEEMKRPMLIAIENELRKIGPEAERLAKSNGR